MSERSLCAACRSLGDVGLELVALGGDHSDAAEPEAAESEASEPEAAESDASESDAAEPDAGTDERSELSPTAG